MTLRSAAALLAPFAGDELFVDEPDHLLGIGGFVVEIAPICSGLQGMGLIGVLVLAYLVRFRRSVRLTRAWLMLPLGIAAAYAANVVRVAALIWLGATWAPDVAYGGFHSKAGWVLTCAIALGLFAGLRRWRWVARDVPPAEGEGANAAAVYLAPLLVSLALMLGLGMFSHGLDRLYPLRLLLVGGVLLAVRRWLPAARWVPSLEPIALGLTVFVLWIALARPADHHATALFTEGLQALGPTARVAWVSARLAGAIVLVPLVEELAFRGFLFRRLVDADFWTVPYRVALVRPWALLASSLAFGALHPSFVAGTLAGGLYALAAARRGRLADAIIAHGVTNAAIAAYALARGQWGWMV